MRDPATNESAQALGPLAIPRPLVLAIALPGLALFVGVMGLATHAGLREFAPQLPACATLGLSVVFPCLVLAVVGVYGALYDHQATRAATRRWTKRLRRMAYAIVGAYVVMRLCGL